MRLNRLTVLCLCVTLLSMAVPTFAQDFRGRINGTVSDNTGAVLPGVTVTATSPALIQPQVQVSGSEGEFRFIALPPGTYDITFELAGFQSTKREGVRVVINQTLTVDQQLNVASLQESVTVTGASPVVDSSTTQVGHLHQRVLTEIPNARDIWQPWRKRRHPDELVRCRRSRTGTQTGFLTYGFGQQNQTKLEGIDTTEGTDANAGYFDFGSSKSSSSVARAAARQLRWRHEHEHHRQVRWRQVTVTGIAIAGRFDDRDNVPDEFRSANHRDEDASSRARR